MIVDYADSNAARRHAVRRFLSRHIVLTVTALSTIALEATGTVAYTAPPAAPAPQAATAKPAKHARPARNIINNSTGSFSITFTGCRENDKQHVSCQFSDPSGAKHWVYLAGVPLPPGR